MVPSPPNFRLDGIYTQRQDGFFMQRIKLAAGVISATQARAVANISARFGRGTIHLTSRGSMEIHWLREDALPYVKRELAKTGLTSRGACGGAVRGVTCSSHGTHGFPRLEALARQVQRHFTGNPRFERLPKKFKVGVEADISGGRHLIQDVGLVRAGEEDGSPWYDVWIAGGLGREPRPGFLLGERFPEGRIIPVIEAVIAVYAANVPPPKRLKFLAQQMGEQKLRELIEAEPGFSELLPAASGFAEGLVAGGEVSQQRELPVFAGELTAGQLLRLADAADVCADGVLQVTADQNILVTVIPGADTTLLNDFSDLSPVPAPRVLRICPGRHECSMGLAETRTVAAALLEQMGEAGQHMSWALSGCPNSCTQPQLAEVGIVSSALVKGDDGERTPRFDLYRRGDTHFNTAFARALTLEQLTAMVRDIG